MSGLFHGLPTRSFSSDSLRLEVLAEAGPRVVGLFLAGLARNLLAESPEVSWNTPYGPYYLRGGHRLWHAPEATPRSCMPDNRGVVIEELLGEVWLHQPTEPLTGITKAIGLRLHPDRPAVTLWHRVQNDGPWPVELAPWAITQLPLGGVVVLPQPEPSSDRVRPNRRLVFWPYTCWNDARLHGGDDYLLVTTPTPAQPFKIGYLNTAGWAGYWWQDIFFCKRFTPAPEQPYPDWGCNVEVYADDSYVELETLAPLSRLEPGQAALHTEVWELYRGAALPADLAAVRAGVQEFRPRSGR